MREFASLLDRLLFMSATLGKRKLIASYLRDRPDPERGYALAALTGALSFPAAKPSLIRELVTERVDPILYALSRDYVGDMAETVALIWPTQTESPLGEPPSLEHAVETLSTSPRAAIKTKLAQWLDALDTTTRWALLKLITGNIRIGVSARLAKTALADAYRRDVDEIEQIWHGLDPPYISLFAWLEGRGERPKHIDRATFMPMMLANPISAEEFRDLDLTAYQIELKWDGIRVQLVRSKDKVALFSRTGDEITETFPDLASEAASLGDDAFVLDGELLTRRQGQIAPFNDLQQRLNRKKPTEAMIRNYPAFIRLYDMLLDRGEDLRNQPLKIRRAALEAWHARHNAPSMDVSEIIHAATHDGLEAIRAATRTDAKNGVEGLMIKRLDSTYSGGRPRGPWFKWKRNTLTLDCVMMYAQRGSGKRSSFYSDYTFGVWQKDTGERKLVPIGKAYSGFTDEELGKLDRWVRGHTKSRFGPVREVEPGLVLEIEFDAIQPSPRHKAGLAMRFPRVHRVRWDKPAHEADTIETARHLEESNTKN